MSPSRLDRIPEHPDNRGVLAYLGRSRALPAASSPGDHPDPYLRAGSHPDVVGRVWDELGGTTSGVRRFLAHGTPALFRSKDGLIVAVALGTSYALRLVDRGAFEEARRAGLTTVHEYRSAHTTLDVGAFGDGWVFGSWHGDEVRWLASSMRTESTPA